MVLQWPYVIRSVQVLVFCTQEKNSINKEGELIITSERFRQQHRNLEDALAKLKEMIVSSAYIPEGPTEETLERIKQRITQANETRVNDKKWNSRKKFDRKNIE